MKIEIEKYKKLRNANIELSNFNVIFGKNNIGKTAILESIHYAALIGIGT